MRPLWLGRSRNEDARIGIGHLISLVVMALGLAAAAVGIVAIVIAAGPQYLGTMGLALLFVVAAVMVYRGMR